MKYLRHVKAVLPFEELHYLKTVKSVRYGTESILFLVPKVWEILPNGIKDSESFHVVRIDYNYLFYFCSKSLDCKSFDNNYLLQ